MCGVSKGIRFYRWKIKRGKIMCIYFEKDEVFVGCSLKGIKVEDETVIQMSTKDWFMFLPCFECGYAREGL